VKIGTALAQKRLIPLVKALRAKLTGLDLWAINSESQFSYKLPLSFDNSREIRRIKIPAFGCAAGAKGVLPKGAIFIFRR
jgi:hypothetical protein